MYGYNILLFLYMREHSLINSSVCELNLAVNLFIATSLFLWHYGSCLVLGNTHYIILFGGLISEE